jgi:hypothetical protein
MKNLKKITSLLTVSAIAFSMAATSFADFGHPGNHWGPPPEGNAGAAGFLVGLEAALLTTISADQDQYDADTLQVQAAAYEDTRIKGAVFDAFANQMAAELGDKATQVDEATFDRLVAQDILKGAAN